MPQFIPEPSCSRCWKDEPHLHAGLSQSLLEAATELQNETLGTAVETELTGIEWIASTEAILTIMRSFCGKKAGIAAWVSQVSAVMWSAIAVADPWCDCGPKPTVYIAR
jgi:hypothetical protein